MKKGFTLSESLTVIFILGIIAVVTIPNLINKRERNNNRITLMKAVNTYKSIITDEYYSATGIRNTDDFSNYLKTNDYTRITSKLNAINTNCSTSSSSCTFSTEDKVYWDISDPSQVIIWLKKTELTNEEENDIINEAQDINNEKVFYISFHSDNRIQILSPINNCTATRNGNPENGINCIQKTRNFILGE